MTGSGIRSKSGRSGFAGRAGCGFVHWHSSPAGIGGADPAHPFRLRPPGTGSSSKVTIRPARSAALPGQAWAHAAPIPASPRLRRRDGIARSTGKAEGASMRLSPRSRAGQAPSSRPSARLCGINGCLPTWTLAPANYSAASKSRLSRCRATPGQPPIFFRGIAAFSRKPPPPAPAVRLVRATPIGRVAWVGGSRRQLRRPALPTMQPGM